MGKYIIALDQGTTSTRAIIFDKNSNIISQVGEEITQYYPQPGWVEHDANEIFSKTLSCMIQAVEDANLSFDDIACIGITNQRETVVVWDKKTSLPVYHAIVWQSNQSKEVCDRLLDKKEMIKEKTGLLINPYFSASKIRWLFDTKKELQERANNGELLCGTIDSWLLYKLTNGKVHATDYSNASRTLLFNIHTLDWDDDLLKLFNIPRSMLPEVKDCSGVFGYFGNALITNPIPISGIAGDQQASLFGQCCFNKGQIKNTYGTGCFALLNTGNQIVDSKNGLLSTIAWKIKDTICYALEGSVFIGGAAAQWLRDGIKIIEKASDCSKYAKSIKSTEGVYVVPAFTGLGTPYWDDECKGAIFGITRGTSKEVIVRATDEAIAYQSKDVIETMKKEANLSVDELSVDGGATNDSFLMQFQADILNAKILLQQTEQTTALGAAYLAGLAVNYFSNQDEIVNLRSIKKVYNPTFTKEEIDNRYEGWKIAINATRAFKPNKLK